MLRPRKFRVLWIKKTVAFTCCGPVACVAAEPPKNHVRRPTGRCRNRSALPATGSATGLLSYLLRPWSARRPTPDKGGCRRGCCPSRSVDTAVRRSRPRRRGGKQLIPSFRHHVCKPRTGRSAIRLLRPISQQLAGQTSNRAGQSSSSFLQPAGRRRHDEAASGSQPLPAFDCP